MLEFKTMEDRIYTLLRDYPQTRDNDRALYYMVCKTMGYDVNISFKDWCRSDYPNTETVRRCRQKVQMNNPSLRSSKEVQKHKDNRRDDIKKWSVS